MRNSGISIHALLAESDKWTEPMILPQLYFYPRSPCGERPKLAPSRINATLYFYPRSPCGERRHRQYSFAPRFVDFYPRSPCGERPAGAVLYNRYTQISIHALLAESDGNCSEICNGGNQFLSTLSLRRATFGYGACFACSKFLSTLSLRRATAGVSAHCKAV